MKEAERSECSERAGCGGGVHREVDIAMDTGGVGMASAALPLQCLLWLEPGIFHSMLLDTLNTVM